jgi:RNA polymerase sigma-70 factor (ECF subfamily)
MAIKSGEYTDAELVEIFHDLRKREYAFNLIVQRYKERLYWHIRKLLIDHDDTDDALQETFLKVWRGLDNFRNESALFTWLYRIATNEALTFLRRKKRRNFLSLTSIGHNLSESLESDAYFNGNEVQKRLQKAILSLPEKQRIVFNMKYYDEMKYDEMAEILETSVGSLKASFHHAVKKIEKYLSDD